MASQEKMRYLLFHRIRDTTEIQLSHFTRGKFQKFIEVRGDYVANRTTRRQIRGSPVPLIGIEVKGPPVNYFLDKNFLQTIREQEIR